jgi:hypothetical protein
MQPTGGRGTFFPRSAVPHRTLSHNAMVRAQSAMISAMIFLGGFWQLAYAFNNRGSLRFTAS